MANLIQIKRSATAATPTSLANGELAFTSNGDILYIGSPNGSVVGIGGARFPGVLTANQALVANSTSGIDEIRVGTANVGAIYANGSLGQSGQILYSNSTGVYWGNVTATVAGSNTQVQFNDSGALAGDADFTFDKGTNTLTSSNVVVSGTTASSNTTSGALTVAGGVGVAGKINAGDLAVGNTTVYTAINASSVSTNNVFATGTVNGSVLSVGGWVIANNSGIFTSGVVNGDIVQVGSFFRANTTVVTIGSGVGLSANGSLGTAGQVLHSNGTSVYWDSDDQGVTSVSTGDGLAGGPITTTGTISVLANNGIIANTNGLFVNPGTGVVVNATGVHVNTSYIATLDANNATYLNGQLASYYTNATNLATGTVPTARLGSGTANANTFLSGDQSYKTAVTSVSTGDGLAGGPITTTGTVSVQANNGIIANTDGVFVRAGTGVTVNSAGVHIGQDVGTSAAVAFGSLSVTGNAALGDSGSDVVSINGAVNTSIMPTANATYNLGNNTIRWAEVHAQNVHSVTGYFDGSVQITGNLSVLGTTTTVSTNNLIVDDSMIQLAANNTTSDLLDIGFFGSYNPDNGAHEHTGLFRDATLDIYRLFKGLQESPTNVVNTAGVGYTIATLEAYLSSGALTTNATTIAITANSTVNVAITANTLTLSSPLAGTSGGTGRATIANNAILVGNTTNGYNELALGSAGYVLQSNGTALVYDTLDGGSF